MRSTGQGSPKYIRSGKQLENYNLVTKKSRYLGFGKTDPWDIHGSSEKRDSRPTEARYQARQEHLRQTCQNFPTDSFIKRKKPNLVSLDN